MIFFLRVTREEFSKYFPAFQLIGKLKEECLNYRGLLKVFNKKQFC
jgi:hypothetical protein